MLHLMQAMLPALERPHEVSALYLDSIFLAVRDHIAEAYGDFTTRASSNRLGLTARQLRHALEYIEKVSMPLFLRTLHALPITSSLIRKATCICASQRLHESSE
jgi:hypothetical protein